MSDTSGIQWTGPTWNPVTGCDWASPGCDLCFARTMAKRLKAMDSPKYQVDGDPRTSGPGFGLAIHPAELDRPRRWRKPRLVFVNSMSDLGHARIPRDFLAQIWAAMAATQRHTFQVLTKRPLRLSRLLSDPAFVDDVRRSLRPGETMPAWPLPNVWLGTSIESDAYTNRADNIRQAPAALRFLSLEPLLGPLPSLDLTAMDWVIVGGESGAGFRPLDLDAARTLRDDCVEREIPFWFKQVGGITPKAGGAELDGRLWEQLPAGAERLLAA